MHNEMKLAVMQPYFIPYTGYFRLFTHTDQFVILDDVQFPRRGWVHRNKLLNRNDQYSWLTLPVKKAPRETKINEILFSEIANELFSAQLSKFKIFQDDKYIDNPIIEIMFQFELPLVDYLELLLKEICYQLNIEFNSIRSSRLGINKSIKGSNRIIEIVKALGARTYLNSPGGKEIYNTDRFEKENIKLEFLSEWNGDYSSILQHLLTEDADKIRRQII